MPNIALHDPVAPPTTIKIPKLVTSHNAALAIRLTENISFLRGTATGEDSRGRVQLASSDAPPTMLRGLLTMKLNKSTRIRKIEIRLDGKSRTEWPEGIGPRRVETSEDKPIIHESIVFFDAAEASAHPQNRRAISVGPGSYLSHDEDAQDDEYSSGGEDAVDLEDREEDRSGRGRSGFQRPAVQGPGGMRSASAFVGGPGSRMPNGSGNPVLPPSQAVGTSTSDTARSRGRGSPLLGPTRRDLDRERGPSPAYTQRDPLRSAGGNRGSPLTMRPRAESFRMDPFALESPAMTDSASYTRSSILAPIASEPPSSSSSQTSAINGGQNNIRSTLSHLPSEGDIGDINMETYSLNDRPPVADQPRSSGELSSSDDRAVRARPTPSPRSSSAMSGSSPGPNRDQHSPSPAPARQEFVSVSRPGSRQSSIVERFPSPSGTPAASIHEGSDGNHAHRGSLSTLMNRSHLGPSSRRPSAGGSGGVAMDRNRNVSNASTATQGGSDHVGTSDMVRKASASGGKHGFFSSALRGFSRSRSKAPAGAATERQPSKGGSPAAQTAQGRMLSPDPNDRPFGRGGAGRSASRGRARNESPADSRHSRSESAGGSRGRAPGSRVFGTFGGEDEGGRGDSGHNWKEFKKGTYNYPISFPLPAGLPPTIHADFGSIIYKLKASVVRVGALTPNFVEEQEVFLIASPSEDDTEETENIIVERQWENQMRYVIALSGKQFPIGGTLPMSIRIVPMSKCALFRLSATIEEKIDYFAMDKKVARHEAVKKYPLLALKGVEKPTTQPLLPIISASPTAFTDSPLAPYAYLAVEGTETPDDVAASLLNPVGPWHVEMNLQVPDCVSHIRFSTKHAKEQLTVAHWLKVVMRMERGDMDAVDAKGKKKQFDIIIETPIHLLDCRVNNLWNSLPTYAPRRAPEGSGQTTGVVCRMHSIGPPGAAGSTGTSGPRLPVQRPTDVTRVPTPAASVITNQSAGQVPPRRVSAIQEVDGDDTLLERNIVFDRLMSGQESELGEAPPTYEDALRRRSRSRSKVAGRSRSRLDALPRTNGEHSRRTASPTIR